MACGGSSPVRSLSVGLHRNGSRVLHVQLLRSCRYSSLVFSVPSQLTRVYQKVTKKQAQDARSKNVKNPLKKMFRRKSSGKPSAKDLLEKALAERKKTVPVGERELVAPHATPTALKPTHHPKKSVDELLAEGNQRSSFLCRTKFFKDMVASAFELVDADGSGEVDEKELYSGLLLIHLKLGTYAGPAACRVSWPRLVQRLILDLSIHRFFRLFYSPFPESSVIPFFSRWIQISRDTWIARSSKLS